MGDRILFINACARYESRTYELAQHLLNFISGKTEQLDLYNSNILPIGNAELENRDKNSKTSDFSGSEFDLAKQFAAADAIVIAAPFWDLSFPAVVKVYLENITVSGLTFEYSKEGRPVGKCSAKKLYYVTTSGGYIGNNNFGFDYVNALAKNFFGIKDVSFYSAEGLDIFGADIQTILSEAKTRISNDMV